MKKVHQMFCELDNIYSFVYRNSNTLLPEGLEGDFKL